MRDGSPTVQFATGAAGIVIGKRVIGELRCYTGLGPFAVLRLLTTSGFVWVAFVQAS